MIKFHLFVMVGNHSLAYFLIFGLLFYFITLANDVCASVTVFQTAKQGYCCVTDRKIRARRNSKALLAKHLMFPPNLKYLEFILESF